MAPPTDQHIIWRCRQCGKWSHARRRPHHHQRFHREHDDYRDERVGWMIWCGPFDRFVAAGEDASPPGPLAQLGQPVNRYDGPPVDRYGELVTLVDDPLPF